MSCIKVVASIPAIQIEHAEVEGRHAQGEGHGLVEDPFSQVVSLEHTEIKRQM
jgi:hypothetical protein